MATALKRGFEEDDSQSSEAATERHPKRHRSEPAQTLPRDSSEVASSPSVSVYNQINCPWCSKSFDAPEEGATTTHSVLKEHIAHVHPRIASISGDVASVKGADTDGTMPDHNVAAVTASVTEVDVTPVGSETPDVMSLNIDTTALLNNKLYDLERQQEHAHNTEKHLMACWNVHDARKFSIDYDRAAADVEEMWHHAFDDSKTTSKKATKSKKQKTLAPYLSTTTEKGKFLEVTPVEEFLDLLDKFESMPTDQLQAASQSVYHALKTWQDEWMAIEELNRRLGNKSKRPNGPRALDPPEVFRDKKEAMLYGYKYDHSIHDPKKREVNSETTFKCQDAFVQGGFRPTPAQLRKMQAEAGKNNTNPDGFRTMKRHGQEYYPRFQDPPLYPFESRGVSAKKRKLPQGEVAALRQPSVHDSTTPALDSDQDGRPFKRLTRSAIGKAVETPQTQTAPPSPGPRARTGKKRGRVAKTASTSRMTVEQVVPEIVEKPVKEAETVKPPHLVASPAVNDFHAESGTEQAEVTPAPMPALAPAAPGAPPALASLPSNILEPGEALTEEERRRREKIANSKNPRRTIAMLDHWSKFHGDGRVRNPKRTKEQMEADRLAEEQRKITVQGKPLVKRRRRKAANGSSDNIAVAQEKKDPSTDAAGMTLQPLSIKPATVVSSAIPPPAPPVKIVPQTYPLVRPIDPEPRLSSRGFPVLHSEPVSVHQSQNQSAPSANGSQPILPSVYAGPAPHSAWNAPSPYFPYGPQLLPRSYHQYGQQQYSHPPPPSHQQAYHVPHAHQPAPHTQPAHHVAGHNRNIQPGLSYPYDSTRPAPHTQNGAQVPRS